MNIFKLSRNRTVGDEKYRTMEYGNRTKRPHAIAYVTNTFVFATTILLILLIVSCEDTGSTEPEKIADSFSYVASPVGTATTLSPNLKGTYATATDKNFTLAASGTGTGTPPTLPAIDAGTGVVSITATTTAGTYIVSFMADGVNTVTTPVYVTTTPANKSTLATAIQTGIASFGLTADFNYIITSSITDMECLFVKIYTINANGSCTFSANARPFLDGFNGDISKWDVSKVLNMDAMFRDASIFNGNISDWKVGAVTDMADMFNGATAFNQDLNKWDVSKVTTMQAMFRGATAFNGNISGWQVGAVTNMNHMFNSARTFNQDLNKWDVSKVTTMISMFFQATEFNGNISDWIVSNVTDMGFMFNGATAFNQNLEKWNVAGSVTKSVMFDNSGLAGNEPSWYP